jgi:hypothetical protein
MEIIKFFSQLHLHKNKRAHLVLDTLFWDDSYAFRVIRYPTIARQYSRRIRAIAVIGISFGQTASHSP